MYQLNKNDFKLIKQYKKLRKDDIALYFFEKFKNELSDIVYSKINIKFSSVPFEKGDLIHLVWSAIKKTLVEYKKDDNFNGVLVNNCYYLAIKEIRKYLNNNELVLNVSSSLDKYLSNHHNEPLIKNTSKIEVPTTVMIKNLIDDVCFYNQKYRQETVKKVIYLKSLGYKNSEVAKKLNITYYYVSDILKLVEKIVKKLYF